MPTIDMTSHTLFYELGDGRKYPIRESLSSEDFERMADEHAKLGLYDELRQEVEEISMIIDFNRGRNILSSLKALIPDRIPRNGPATIVIWADGSKTIVKRSKDTTDDPYNAYCAALAKKIYGSNSRVHKIVAKTEVQSNEKSLVEQLKDTINDLARKLNEVSGEVKE